MTIPDFQDKKFQDLIRNELGLSESAVFGSCGSFAGTEIFGHCIGTVTDGDMIYILLRCSFVISGDTMILNLDVPGAPRLHGAEEEVRKAGMDPRKVRLVGICTGTSQGGTPATEKRSAIQVVLIPY